MADMAERTIKEMGLGISVVVSTKTEVQHVIENYPNV
jgi:hypothetical protein